MKKLTSFALLFSLLAVAAFAQAPQARSLIVLPSGGGPYVVNGNVSSNIPVTQAYPLPIGPNGFGLSGTFGVTNAITNGTTLTIELIGDIYGTNAMSAGNAQQNTMSFIVPAVGTTPFYYWTNVPGTAVNLGNLPRIRLKTVNPTNATSAIFITNLHVWTR